MKYLILAFVITWSTQCYCNFVFFPPGFGDTRDPEILDYYMERCYEECDWPGPIVVCTYTHPNACNLYVECTRFLSIWVVHGRIAPAGNVYDDWQQRLRESISEDGPNAEFCHDVGHPCVNGRPVPTTAKQCGGYMMCENNVMVQYQCQNKTGFNAWTGQCDLPCHKRLRRVQRTDCGPSGMGERFFQINETVVYGDGSPDVEVTDTQCPSFTAYKVMGKCGCDHINVTVQGCKTTEVIHFSSSDNSWELAKNNTPITGGASITGNAEVVRPNIRNFGRSAFFKDGSYFVSERMNGNDLGYYFDMAFTFQAMREGGDVPGATIPSGQREPSSIALVDNSADGKEATYGCMLRVVSTDRGKVVCYVRPSRATGDKDRNDITVDSHEVDLTRRVSVLFAKDGTKGLLTVTMEGAPERNRTFGFPDGIRAIGNKSPLVIGTGTMKKPFTGYIDDLYVKKYCDHFM